MDEQIKKIKSKRWEQFCFRDKDPYICYRFTVALEELLPPHLSQIKMMSAVPDGEISSEQMTIELDPIKVAERYIQNPVYEDIRVRPDTGWYAEIKELAHQYMDYLYSNALERLKYYDNEREKWERFI